LTSKPLDIESTDSTLPNIEETIQPDETAFNNLNGAEPHEAQASKVANDVGITSQRDHIPEPPASPSDDTSSPLPAANVEAGAVKTPSASRLSISYSRGNRRFVIDAEVVESVNLFRHEGRIEVTINVEKNTDGSLKGILVWNLSFRWIKSY
jgi:20S proteasome subunit alpha 6